MEEFETFIGVFEIEFIIGPRVRRVDVVRRVEAYSGNILYLVGEDGTIYPWNGMVSLKRIDR